ncbi:MAG: hypothetical protein ACFFEF_18910 [Candidatus Thorarchaeota archaeon]
MMAAAAEDDSSKILFDPEEAPESRLIVHATERGRKENTQTNLVKSFAFLIVE